MKSQKVALVHRTLQEDGKKQSQDESIWDKKSGYIESGESLSQGCNRTYICNRAGKNRARYFHVIEEKGGVKIMWLSCSELFDIGKGLLPRNI